MLLGCIGDDFTGSSDLANTLSKQGMKTAQYTGIPEQDAAADIDAGVVSLKSRSIPVEEAIKQSLAALEWLKAQGCTQFFFKYCSTFDSTPEGNIGQVADALAEALGAETVIVCPAFPGAGRTVYQGYLFVNDVLLNESGMQNHPLTPMTDPDLRRWLAQQTKFEVGHVKAVDVLEGSAAISKALSEEQGKGKRLIVVDATRDADLMAIGEACADLPLITGGSGVALGLPNNFRQRGLIGKEASQWHGESGKCAILSGSCSIATRAQLAEFGKDHPMLEITAADVLNGKTTSSGVSEWLLQQEGIGLAYSSADPDTIKAVQKEFGRDASAQALENLFGEVASKLVAAGVTRLITAGGETSGAVVEALDIGTMEIGPEIDPGVPAMRAGDNLVIALKSGNFGAEDFFVKAARVLEAG